MHLESKKEVYRNGGIVLIEKVFRSNDQKITRVVLSLGKNAVLVIPIDKDGNFYLGRQKEGDSTNSILEFPNGGIEKDENEIDAAKRELSEELGLEGRMIFLGKFRPFDNLVDLEVNVFVCKDVVEQLEIKKQKPDFYEKIQRESYTEKGLYDLIHKGGICGSYLLSALSIYKA